MTDSSAQRDQLYASAAEAFGAAIVRVARGYEFHDEKRRDLVQDIHLALWRSLARFEARCALGTWVYRIAHNVGARHIASAKREGNLVALDDDRLTDEADVEGTLDRQHMLAALQTMIHRLAAPDRQVMLLYLEDLPAAEIADVTGLSPGNVAVKIHRIKTVLAQRFAQGDPS
jgi:RNA polymerase sigma-70 factor (ECF subfamily)